MLLKEKVTLVTGAAGGIGAACAIAFAQNGAKAVYVIDINEEKAKETIGQISAFCACHFIKADVSCEDDVISVFDDVEDRYGRLDVLVNCAGICSVESFEELQLSTWDRLMDINLKGALLFSRDAMRLMKRNGYGRIVNVGSISGQVGGIRTSPAYSVSKAGVMCLTKSLAKSGAKDRITVNSIAPGIITTDMVTAPGFHYSTDEIPMGYAGSPEEVADVVLFLASDMSRYVTGQCIGVNGGMFMGF